MPVLPTDPLANLTIERVMSAWLDCALDYWKCAIMDTQPGYPGDKVAIGRFFDGAPWAMRLMGGRYDERASGSAWCGHFQATCGRELGNFLGAQYTAAPNQCLPVWLDPAIQSKILPSTRRIASAKRWLEAGYTTDPTDDLPSPASHWANDWADSEIPEGELAYLAELCRCPRVACIVSWHSTKQAFKVYGDRRDVVGGHYVLIESVDIEAGTYTTVEGNGWGELCRAGGDGTPVYGEGVVRNRGDNARPLKELRRVYEFTLEHFEIGGRP